MSWRTQAMEREDRGDLFVVEMNASRIGPAMAAMLDRLCEAGHDPVPIKELRRLAEDELVGLGLEPLAPRSVDNMIGKLSTAGLVKRYQGDVYVTPLGAWWLEDHMVV